MLEFDKDYLEKSKISDGYTDYVGAFFSKHIPLLKQKLEDAREQAGYCESTDLHGDQYKFRNSNQETEAYGRVVHYLESYLDRARTFSLLDVDE
jgi:hypothetical protein